MRFFDAHCDTVTRVRAGDGHIDEDARASRLHVTLAGLLKAGVGAQVFALWAWEGAYGREARTVADDLVERLLGICRTHSENLAFVSSSEDLERASLDPDRVAVICGLEGADPLQGDPGALRSFFDRGVRLLTLAWGDNEFCGTVFGQGGGLSPSGHELVEFCEELGVIVDVSHASDAAFADICRVATNPFVASHSNCRSVCPNTRNLSDAMIRALAERGGVMGINLGSSFLSPDFHAASKGLREDLFRDVASGRSGFLEAQEASAAVQKSLSRPPLALAADHVRHAIDVGGEDCVGLGGDLDGVKSLPEGIDRVDDYPRIAEALLASGLSSRQVDKVCFDNFARVFADLLPAP